MDRLTELEALAKDVQQAFHRLPQCPRGLRASATPLGNIIIESYGRTFTINALVIDRAYTAPGWCESVLRLVLGVPGQHVEEAIKRAQVSAALQRRELEVLRAIEKSDHVQSEIAEATWPGIAKGLYLKGLLVIDVRVNQACWKLSDAGKDALAAHDRW